MLVPAAGGRDSIAKATTGGIQPSGRGMRSTVGTIAIACCAYRYPRCCLPLKPAKQLDENRLAYAALKERVEAYVAVDEEKACSD